MSLSAILLAALAPAVCFAEPGRSWDFDTEIMPVLTRAGCNAGACHGAAAGRGGFHLSLLGSDPASDHAAIVQEFEGRRINPAHPERSLLLAKPTGRMDHGGNTVLQPDGAGAARLVEWIRDGAPRGSSRRLLNLRVSYEPLQERLPASERGTPTAVEEGGAGRPSAPGVSERARLTRVPIQVTATFQGASGEPGEPQDVTAWTVFTPADPAAVEVGEDYVARVTRRGQHVVMARFLSRVVPLQFSVPLSDQEVKLAGEPRANFVDDEILRVLSELRVPVSPPATDAAWLRRVSLDLTGRLPEPALINAQLQDKTPDKRGRLVDSLLNSEAYADYWTLKFARLLRLHSLTNEPEALQAYSTWLRREIAADTGLDQLARQLLTATGDSHVVGPANFGRMVADARGQAELVGQFFLGARLGCANCHNHPLDKWTQADYHGLAAVFARLDRGREVRLLSRGAVTNPRTCEPAVPRIPGVKDLPEGDNRQAVADWLTAGTNRQFAKATVNRLWRALFGRGLVEPTDDMRETNPPTHPALLDRLADDFVEHGCSLRHTLRLLALSNTYGRSDSLVEGNARDDRFYSHAFRRPLEPEVLADAIADVTGVPEEYAGQPGGTRAVALIDPLSPASSLDVLGRCTLLGGCEEKPAVAAGLEAQLHLLNGEFINGKLTAESGRLRQSIAAQRTYAEIVDEFYQRALGRHATDAEAARWSTRLQAADESERRQRLEDFVWSLLNSRQFMENH